MPHFLHEYPTELLVTILSKMNRTVFLRLSRSCKWVHNFIEENKRHITNCVTNDKISITIQKPRLRRQNGYWNAPEPNVDPPLFYKLAVGEQNTKEFLTYEMFCHKMVQFHELRLTELKIYSVKTDHAVKLVEYLHSRQISCEKLIILFPQDREYLPDELTDFLRPLKIVILPIRHEWEDEMLWSYNHLASNVEHISLFEVQQQDVHLTLFKRNILTKKSVYIHYVHNFIQEDDPFEYDEFYGDLLSFYKFFHSFMSDGSANLKDFQFYFQNYRDHEFDPVLDDQEPNDLLMYITGDRQPQKMSKNLLSQEMSVDSERQRETSDDESENDEEEYEEYCQGSPTVYIEDPDNPDGPPFKAEFSSFLDDGFYDRRSFRDAYHQADNYKKSLLLETWVTSTKEFHLNRMVVSITEGRKEKEHIMTLFADSSEKMRVYFAIAVLTDWDSYTRFIGLMDTKNYEFPMEEIEDDVKDILCP